MSHEYFVEEVAEMLRDQCQDEINKKLRAPEIRAEIETRVQERIDASITAKFEGYKELEAAYLALLPSYERLLFENSRLRRMLGEEVTE